MEPLALTIADTLKALSVGRTTIYKLIGEGRLETVKVGRRTLVLMASVHKLLAAKPNQ